MMNNKNLRFGKVNREKQLDYNDFWKDNEPKREIDEEMAMRLREKRETLGKARKNLDEKLNEINELTALKTRLQDEYTLGLSQTSSDSLIEPMMKLKTFIKKEEELVEVENQCEKGNKEIKEKTVEAQESLAKLKFGGRGSENSENEEVRAHQKVDETFAEKIIGSFVEGKRRKVLEDLENRETMKAKINERKQKYQQIWAEFSKTLETQEPYLKQKIEDSVHKNLNIEEKKAEIKKLRLLFEELQSKDEAKPDSTKGKNLEKKEENTQKIGEEEAEAKEESVLRLMNQNRDSLRHIQASKIRINEFIAKNILAVLEELQKASKNLESNLTITFENWEKIYMLPADVYYTNSPEENYSPILQEMLKILGKPNQSYFTIPKLIKKVAKRLAEERPDRFYLENTRAEEILGNNQLGYQQQKRKKIGELIDVEKDLELEMHYKERLESLLEICEHPPAIECADVLKQYEGWTLSDYLAKWRKIFGPLSQGDTDI